MRHRQGAYTTRWRWLKPAAFLGIMLLGGCAGTIERADDYIAQEEWMKAVIEYRKAAAKSPADVEYRSRLRQTELKAADYYYQRGIALLEQDNPDGAILQFQQGLASMKDHTKLLQAMNQTLLRKEATTLYGEALGSIDAGKPDEAVRLLKRAVDIYPDFKRAADLLARTDKQALEDEDSAERLMITSRAPLTLNFRQTDLRTAFEFVAKSFGIDVIFDDGVRSVPVTLFAKDVTFEQALNLIFATTKTFYKRIGPNTILIAPDTKEKRGQYEDQMVRTFQLGTIRAKEMADILKGLVTVKKIIINESLNTLIARDSEEVLKVVSKIIENNDRRSAELILEVEILEVNRSKAERLGLDLGTYRVAVGAPSLPIDSSIRNALTLTLPSAAFDFYKQDVDAKTLANPRLRVLSGKSAKIHIGDRVPLLATTIQDATGQVRNSYDYKEVGIRLNAEPVVHLDNSVTVKVMLEVSTLGENLGTQTQPAFRIGTRNAETYMTLRDGETAILGGLIRDEERKTRVRVPLLGDIPIIGAPFTAYNDSNGRTDVLLTITPRVVRGWDLPGKDARMFASGSEDRFTLQPLFPNLAPAARGSKIPAAPAAGAATIVPPLTPPNAPIAPAPSPAPLPARAASPEKPPAADKAADKAAPTAEAAVVVPAAALRKPPLFGFSDAVYESAAGNEFEIKLSAENLDRVTGLSAEILFNPQLLKYVRNEAGSFPNKDYRVEADETRGVIRIAVKFPEDAAASGPGILARIVMRGDQPGVSYLVYRTPTITGDAGAGPNVQVRASRVVIK